MPEPGRVIDVPKRGPELPVVGGKGTVDPDLLEKLGLGCPRMSPKKVLWKPEGPCVPPAYAAKCNKPRSSTDGPPSCSKSIGGSSRMGKYLFKALSYP